MMLKRVRLPTELVIDKRVLPLRVRRMGRSRHMRLRYDDVAHQAVLTMPVWARNGEAMEFLRASDGWLKEAMQNRKRALPFDSGAVIPYRGGQRVLCYDMAANSRVYDDGERLICGGDYARFAERIEKFLRLRARRLLEELAQEYHGEIAMNLDGDKFRPYQRVRIGDAKSCWGSCSSSGTLSFSWRLVLLRDELVRYVVVHELCHLRYMDHSSAFWGLVGLHVPNYEALRRELHDVSAEVRMVGVPGGS